MEWMRIITTIYSVAETTVATKIQEMEHGCTGLYGLRAYMLISPHVENVWCDALHDTPSLLQFITSCHT